MYDLLVRNGKLVTPDRIYEADIAIQDGKYAAFLAKGTEAEAKEVIDAKGNYVFPGIIDCHAHLNEPGFEYREDFETGSRAAVVAGCTCLIDMPLNNDPSLMNKEIFDLKLSKVSRHSLVDYALWGGLVGDYDNKPDSVEKQHKRSGGSLQLWRCRFQRIHLSERGPLPYRQPRKCAESSRDSEAVQRTLWFPLRGIWNRYWNGKKKPSPKTTAQVKRKFVSFLDLTMSGQNM